MNPQTFFDHFERLTDAPQSIARLREFVLHLAVQGKLVAQDEREEPAARLLERIATERKRLVREKKIREAKPLTPVSNAEKPFETPQGWMWARFGEVTINRDGERVPIEKSIREYRQGEYDYYGASGVIDKFDDYIFDKPLLLIGEDGANLVNRSTPIAFIAYGNYWVNNHAHVLDSISLDCLKYLELYINATDLLPYITGTAQPKMNQAKMNAIPVAVPPLEEQKRIVAKVDELMRLCDELERRQAERRVARLRLNRAALDQLLAASDATEFQARWRTVRDQFTTLTATPDLIGKLRQTVLQLAVQGKLTRQDPQDEPATSLLRRIRAERERLVKEKRLKRAESLPPVNPDKMPFNLPSGWALVRLGEIAEKLGAGSTPLGGKNVYQQNGVKFLRSQNVWDDGLRLENVAYISSEIHQRMSGTSVEPSDILLNITGASIGRSSLVPDDISEANVSQHVAIIRLIDKSIRFFVHLCLISPLVQASIMQMQVGISREGLSMRSLKDFLIPLPPLEEQKRIVAAVNRLMALCDELEAILRRAEEDGERLLRAAVRSLLASASEISTAEADALVVQ